MIKYDLFKQMVEKKYLSFFPKEYQDYDVKIDKQFKRNIELDSIVVITGRSAMPMQYINDMYNLYQRTGDFDKTLSYFAEQLCELWKNADQYSYLSEELCHPDHIVFDLVNYEDNKEFLGDKPYRKYLDMAIIYRSIITMEDDGISSFVITNSIAKDMQMSEEQLYNHAEKNTRTILPLRIRKLTDCVRDMLNDDEIEVPDTPFLVLSNERNVHGAAAILYEDCLYEVSEEIGDFYIIPSSVHEVILVSSSDCEISPLELAEMVYEVNFSVVDQKDRLSNQVYYYNSDIREVVKATDSIHKSLKDDDILKPADRNGRNGR